jgi:predicted dehydrogenase
LAYDIHLLLWLFGNVRLTHAEGIMVKRECAQIFADFEANGVPLRCQASQLLPPTFPFTVRTKVIGTKATLHWEVVFPATAAPTIRYERYDRDRSGPVELKFRDPFVSQLKHFAAVVRGDEADDRISAKMARRTVELAEDVFRRVSSSR